MDGFTAFLKSSPLPGKAPLHAWLKHVHESREPDLLTL